MLVVMPNHRKRSGSGGSSAFMSRRSAVTAKVARAARVLNSPSGGASNSDGMVASSRAEFGSSLPVGAIAPGEHTPGIAAENA